jgi:hypothetical protein
MVDGGDSVDGTAVNRTMGVPADTRINYLHVKIQEL